MAKPKELSPIPDEAIDNMIRELRGIRVMLDRDLGRVYGVTTKVLNQAVKRNLARFPKDFMFQLTEKEAVQVSRSQIVTASSSKFPMRSQNVTASKRNIRYRPYAFTEHGALQAANILNSPRAVQMSVFVIRAFVKMRETLLGTRDLAKKLAALEKQLTGRLDTHEVAIVNVLQQLMHILNPPPPPPAPPKPRIGFDPDK
ncbi:MAG: ORF6N domain-containing protein [Chthoniobacterales bacterium]|nr:ORF6N domain-containing protein [Chthoniobacterales bacterium]